MSFLTPLYLLGAIAVALPVVLHMIRRTPRGRQDFSSVMFLEPSPPRITSRSKVEHWLLLLLRAMAVCLLALAFARPFLRTQDGKTVAGGDFREVVILLDTSASMRRDGVWDAAVDRLTQFIKATEPGDRVELLTFDRQPRVLLSSEQWAPLTSSQRVSTVQRLLSDVTPSWASTDLGRALIEAAERLDDEREIEGLGQKRKIIVVSDLQQGARTESLQSYQWPKHMTVEFMTAGQDVSPNNAGLHSVRSGRDEQSADEVRVRVTNAADARREQFTLRWGGDPAIEVERSAVSVIVSPGKSRVVTIPRPQSIGGSPPLLLEGDDHPYDNTCHIGSPGQSTVNVTLFSNDVADDPGTMWYYVERALIETPERAVALQIVEGSGEAIIDNSVDLLVVTIKPNSKATDRMRELIRDGATALVVPADAEQMSVLVDLLEVSPVETGEADVADYVMLGDIDFTHPLFAALDQPRYSDFTKVRFWKHRSLDIEAVPDARVLARFDDGEIAAGQVTLGDGKIVFLTSGWHPADSQLALSTKFVPMLNSLLDDAAGMVRRQSQYVVGDTVDLAEFLQAQESPSAVITPIGDQINIESDNTSFNTTDQPGRYSVRMDEAGDDPMLEFVVNIDPSESDTSLLSVESLRATGVPMDLGDEPLTPSEEVQRQLHNSELESQQKIWKWIIIAAILVLFIETYLASRLATST